MMYHRKTEPPQKKSTLACKEAEEPGLTRNDYRVADDKQDAILEVTPNTEVKWPFSKNALVHIERE